ncbi:MAG: HEAT repeat domain-containing protein [Candidatus Ozemobacteraceae bacterium]
MGDITPILNFLHSAYEADRRQGILDLVRSGDPMAMAILTKLAAEDPSVEIRYYARRAAGSLKPPPVTETLPTEQTPPDEHVPSTEQKSPTGQNDQTSPQPNTLPAADASLCDLFASTDPKVRFEGLKRALTKPSPETLLLVRQGYEQEPVAVLKASFVIALGRLGSEDEIDLLGHALEDTDSRIRANAVEALASIGSEKAFLHLIPLLQDEDNRVRANVIKALQTYGGAALLDLLRNMALEGEIWMRDSALFALSRFQSPHTMTIIAKIAADDPLERLRTKAFSMLETFARSGNAAAREFIATLRPTSPAPSPEPVPDLPAEPTILSPNAPQAAIIALVATATAEDLPTILKALSAETDPMSITMLLSILKRIKCAEAFDSIVPFLSAQDDRIRANAADALSMVDPERARPLLLELLEDPDNRIRANAILALSADDLFDPVPSLISLAHDPREMFRRSAIYVMTLVRRPIFVPLLGRLLDDADGKVRDPAYAALEEYVIGGIDGAEAIQKRIASRIKIHREQDAFFENAFDHLFSSVLETMAMKPVPMSDTKPKPLKSTCLHSSPEKRVLSTDKQPLVGRGCVSSPRDTEFSRREEELLQTLAEKAIQTAILSPEILEEFKNAESERERLAAAAEAADTRSRECAAAGDLPGGTTKSAEALRLRDQANRLRGKRKALLIKSARRLIKDRGLYTVEERAALDPELNDVVLFSAVHVPGREVSLLPSPNAPPSEIFDLTLRIYQKHVVAFSMVPLGIILAIFLFGFFALIAIGFGKAINAPLGFLLAGIAIPVGCAAILRAHAFFTALITRMMAGFVSGETLNYRVLTRNAWSESGPLVILQIRKMWRLSGWFSLACFGTGMSTLILSPILGGDLFGKACVKLVAFGVFLLIFGKPYLHYLLVEPWYLLAGRNRPDDDPFEESSHLVAPRPGQTLLLFLLTNLLSMFISGSTQELLLFIIVIPQLKAIPILVGALSQICLYALSYATLIVFTMMLIAPIRDEADPENEPVKPKVICVV